MDTFRSTTLAVGTHSTDLFATSDAKVPNYECYYDGIKMSGTKKCSVEVSLLEFTQVTNLSPLDLQMVFGI